MMRVRSYTKWHRLSGMQFDSVLLADASKQMVEVADVIILSLVLLHVPDTEKLLGALYKILNKDGRLIIVDFDKNYKIDHPKVHNGFTHEEIKDNLLKAGFKSPAVETFHHGTGIFMKEDASLFLAGCTKQDDFLHIQIKGQYKLSCINQWFFSSALLRYLRSIRHSTLQDFESVMFRIQRCLQAVG